MSPDLWQRGCELLATEMPEQQFNTWIRPLMAGGTTEQGLLDEAEAAVVSVRVANRFKLDWIRAQYAGRIEAVLSELAGRPVRLDLSVAPRGEAPAPSPAMALRRSNGVAASTLAIQALQMPTEAHQPVPLARNAAAAGNTHRLNPALTFDTLVAGRANQMARTAALHVAGAPGVMYNPLINCVSNSAASMAPWARNAGRRHRAQACLLYTSRCV